MNSSQIIFLIILLIPFVLGAILVIALVRAIISWLNRH